MLTTEFVYNGQASGDVASRLLQCNFDPRAIRPFVGPDGHNYITTNNAQGKEVSLVTNAPASLRYDDWKQLDDAIVRAAMPRLRAAGDLRADGLVYSIPNGMAKTVLMYQTQNKISGATISMDGLARGDADRPEYDLRNLPLPIISKDFQFSAREIATSRSNGHQPIDTSMAEDSARAVAEEVEKLTIGSATTFTYGGGTIYGYTNLPQRLTKVLTAPVAANGTANSSWSPALFLKELLEMRKQSTDAYHYGPWRLYNSPNWDMLLDNDFSTAYPGVTLRDRVLKVEGFSSLRTLDFLTGWQIIMCQMTSNIVRLVIGMDLTTVQWETYGGMQLNFKVMCIMVPQLRFDHNNNTGLVHGTATPA